jgi:hypothetical protein
MPGEGLLPCKLPPDIRCAARLLRLHCPKLNGRSCTASCLDGPQAPTVSLGCEACANTAAAGGSQHATHCESLNLLYMATGVCLLWSDA